MLAVAACGSARTVPRGEREKATRAFVQEGLASYYSSSLAGNRTASGQRYDPKRLTAAHRTLPFGTWIVVSRIDDEGRVQGPRVRVQVNDRGPWSGRRVLDLSYEAARQLGLLRIGVARVRIEAAR